MSGYARPPRRPPPRRRRRARRRAVWAALALAAVLAVVGVVASRGGSGGTATTQTAPPVTRLLIREGLRREDIARAIAQQTTLSGAQYLALTGPGALGRALAGTSRPTSLEGFLFPATYEIGPTTTVRELVNDQLAAYRAATAGIDYRYAHRHNLSRYDVLTIASLVEREVQRPEERAIVAGVIYNRLHLHMPLGIDATVQYAIGSWKATLTAHDLAIDSPYNTRKYAGLPPGPICSPGRASLIAAAHPVRTRYLYYVARADGTGRHYFARTQAEFQADIARARANARG